MRDHGRPREAKRETTGDHGRPREATGATGSTGATGAHSKETAKTIRNEAGDHGRPREAKGGGATGSGRGDPLTRLLRSDIEDPQAQALFREFHPDGTKTLNNKDLGVTVWETTGDHKSNGRPREATGDHGGHGF